MNKLIFPFLFVSILFSLSGCQKSTGNTVAPVDTSKHTYTVTVNNGYGSGTYKPGDTVNIFSKEYTSSQIFGSWGGDVSYLNTPTEWRSWFIMPSKSVSFTATIKSITPFTLKYEMIKGKNVLKPVYSFFPANQKGFVFLLHGTGGTASNFVSDFEDYELITDLVANGFAVVITESEESTLGDMDGNGKIQWEVSPADSVNNVDYANIKIITDTFYNRKVVSKTVPRFSIGMSNGGNFSAYLSSYFNYKSGVSYCAQTSPLFIATTTTPLEYNMQQNDDADEVGAQGNAVALSNYQQLVTRGICSKYFINQPAPLYPERFARSSLFTVSLSQTLQAEFKAKGFLNTKNYFIGHWQDYYNAYLANPSNFPVFKSLNGYQQYLVSVEIECSVTEHHFYCDHDFETIDFLENLCN